MHPKQNRSIIKHLQIQIVPFCFLKTNNWKN